MRRVQHRRRLHRRAQSRRCEPRSTEDYEALARRLARRGVDDRAAGQAGHGRFGVAHADLGRRHRRHALRALSRARRAAQRVRQDSKIARRSTSSRAPRRRCRRISPGTRPSDTRRCARAPRRCGLGFDAVNSNTFQDQPGQALSYKFGIADPCRRAVRAQAIAHNIDCIAIGRKLGSKALTRVDRRRLQLRRPVEPDRARSTAISTAMREIYAALPARLAAVPRAQALRAGLLLDRDRRLGHQLRGGAGAGARRRSAWSTSATTRRTSISSRSSRG